MSDFSYASDVRDIELRLALVGVSDGADKRFHEHAANDVQTALDAIEELEQEVFDLEEERDALQKARDRTENYVEAFAEALGEPGDVLVAMMDLAMLFGFVASCCEEQRVEKARAEYRRDCLNRTAARYATFKLGELRDMAIRAGVTTDGTKAVLARRIAEAKQ